MKGILQRIRKIIKGKSKNTETSYNSLFEKVEYYRGNLATDFPSDFSETERIILRELKPFTMTSQERLVCLLRAVEYIVKAKVSGQLIECGVWRGGSMMAACYGLLAAGDKERELLLFDTYVGMTEPESMDISVNNEPASVAFEKNIINENENNLCLATLDEVKQNLARTGYPKDKIHFIKGRVEETIPHPLVANIALLRLDTDWYKSTKHELEYLFPRLVSGGILIIDDYGHWKGSQKAVDEYFLSKGILPFLHRIDYTARLYIKP